MAEKPPQFENNKDLEALLTQMVDLIPELEHVRSFKVGIVYTNRSLGKKNRVAVCSKITGAVRFKSGIDYIIRVRKAPFLAETREEQLRIVLHEAYHIIPAEKSEGRKLLPAIRDHEGDFCELPNHDAYIRGLVDKYGKKLDKAKALVTQTSISEAS